MVGYDVSLVWTWVQWNHNTNPPDYYVKIISPAGGATYENCSDSLAVKIMAVDADENGMVSSIAIYVDGKYVGDAQPVSPLSGGIYYNYEFNGPAGLTKLSLGTHSITALATFNDYSFAGATETYTETSSPVGINLVDCPDFMQNGLVAYYPFNGNANDASGNGNDGTAVGATLCPDRFGNPNSAYHFDGSSYIGFNSVPLDQVDNWTISAWINPFLINQDGMAVCLGYDDGNTGNGFAFGLSSYDSPANTLSGVFGGVAWAPSGYAFPVANRWHHIVMLRRNGVTQYYVDGIQNQTWNKYTQTPILPSAFTIGSSTGIRFFSGGIDDVRIYNRALSASEVQRLYNFESKGTSFAEYNLNAYYPFSGDAHDASGHGNEGDISYDVWQNSSPDRFKQPGSCYNFLDLDGVNFSGPPITQTDNWTMVTWVNPSLAEAGGYSTALLVGYDNGYNIYNGVGLGVNYTSLGCRIYAPDGVADLNDAGDNTVNPGDWHQLVALRDRGTTTCYLDGNILPLSPYSSTTTPNTPTGFSIGVCAGNGDAPFTGLIDEPRIYSRALSSAEVQRLYVKDTDFVTLQATTINGNSIPMSLTNGLVAYYPFNGDAHDATENGNDGEVVGATPCNDRLGNPNSAFSFNGVGNYIRFVPVPLCQTDNWTISAWLNPSSIAQDGMAVCLGYDDGNTGNGFSFGLSANDTPSKNLSGVLGGVAWAPSGYAFPSANVWHHIVMLRSNGVTQYYVDGIQNQTWKTYTQTPITPSSFTIGSSTGIRFFNGAIDNVRVYNRALSATEVNALYIYESNYAQ